MTVGCWNTSPGLNIFLITISLHICLDCSYIAKLKKKKNLINYSLKDHCVFRFNLDRESLTTYLLPLVVWPVEVHLFSALILYKK